MGEPGTESWPVTKDRHCNGEEVLRGKPEMCWEDQEDCNRWCRFKFDLDSKDGWNAKQGKGHRGRCVDACKSERWHEKGKKSMQSYYEMLVSEIQRDPIYYAMLAAIIILVLVNVALIIYHRKKLMSAFTKIVARIKGFFVVTNVTHPSIETTSAPLSYGAQIKGFFMVKKVTPPSIKPTSAPLSYEARVEGFFAVKQATHPSIKPTSPPICYGV